MALFGKRVGENIGKKLNLKAYNYVHVALLDKLEAMLLWKAPCPGVGAIS